MGDTVCSAMASVSALVSVLAALCASASADSMPLFSWTSTKGAFDQVEPQSANALLAAKHKDFKASVVYLHSLSTEQLAMHKDATKQMQSTIQSSGSSIFRPLKQSNVQPDELVSQYSGEVVSASEAMNFVQKNADMFKSAEPQLLVVDMRSHEHGLDKLREADSIRAQLHKTLDSLTGGSLLSVLASTNPAPGRKLLWVEAHPVPQTGGTTTWNFYPQKTGGVSHLTPSALLALMATIYMFFIAICGYCCLFSLQTPDLFEGDQKKEMARALGTEEGK